MIMSVDVHAKGLQGSGNLSLSSQAEVSDVQELRVLNVIESIFVWIGWTRGCIACALDAVCLYRLGYNGFCLAPPPFACHTCTKSRL